MQSAPAATSDLTHDGRHSFDFLNGRWRIANERLRERLVGCTEWDRFDADGTCRLILGGSANIDDFRPVPGSTGWEDFEGGALRIFDPATQLWSIHWHDNRVCSVIPPTIGCFEPDGQRGEFFGDDAHNGVPVRVRFIWTIFDADHLQWEQAFSTDGGETWETNWYMRFTRTGAPFPVGLG